LPFLFRFSFLGSAGSFAFPSLRTFLWGFVVWPRVRVERFDFGDLVPADCVLRRLSEELFALAFPAISTWKLLKDRMASEGSSWPQVRSEELPSGLSDREDGGNSLMKPRQSRARRRVTGLRSSGSLDPISQLWTRKG
jgi:hypothetical protein